MSQPMKKIAAIQLVSSTNLDENLQVAEKLIAKAARAGAALIVLPENFATFGFSTDSLKQQSESLKTMIVDWLKEQSVLHNIYLLGGSFPFLDLDKSAKQQKFFARSILFSPQGQEIAAYNKMHLFDANLSHANSQEVYKESDQYQAGNDVVCQDIEFAKLGLSICYDLRFPELFRSMFQQAVDIIAVPSAFTQQTGEAHWLTLLKARAIENACYVIAANQGGRHSHGRETFGHSCIISPWGEVLSLCEKGEGIAIAEFSRDFINEVRAKIPVHQHQRIQITTS